MKKVFLGIAVLICVAIYLASGDYKTEGFVHHQIQEGQTACDILTTYNDGLVCTEELEEGLLLINPHLKGKWEGEIQVPVFK